MYVEVKSSSQDDKDLFEISPAEFDMAARERASYHVRAALSWRLQTTLARAAG